MQYFSNLTVQSQIVERLTEGIKRKRLAHAYLFYGPEGSGKDAVALELAKAINCLHPDTIPCNKCASCNKITLLNHPDIKYIFPTATSWSVEDIKERIRQKSKNPYAAIDLRGHTSIPIAMVRELKTEAKFAPYEAEKKVYIVSHAEKMTRESSNSFLKILEEPPSNLLIILTTSSLDLLLDTIRSRCQLVYFHPPDFNETLSVVSRYHPITPKVEKIARIAQGNLAKVFNEVENEQDDLRKQMYTYLHSMLIPDDLQMFRSIDEMARIRDKNYLMNILVLLILWFQDALHIQSFGQQTDIVHADFQAEIIQFADHYPLACFEDIISLLDQAAGQIRQNVYSPVVLTVLAFRIRKILKQKKV
jgi:DNA polymerase-3 subunit delta'